MRSFTLLICILVLLLCCLGISFGWYLYRPDLLPVAEQVSKWKQSDWLVPNESDLWSRALIAAEDPSFFSGPKLDCGPFAHFKALAEGHSSRIHCSPLISSATRLAISSVSIKPKRRLTTDLALRNDLSKQPLEALAILLNKAYLGSREDDSPIEGFKQAAIYYFRRPLNLLSFPRLRFSQAWLICLKPIHG